MKIKYDEEVEVNEVFQKKPLPERIMTTVMKGALSTSLLAVGFAPTVQAYEQAKASGAESIAPRNFDFQPMLSKEDVGLTSRRSQVNRVGDIGRSMDYMTIEEMERNLAVNDPTTALDFDEILAKGILSMNRDKVSMELNFNSAEVASSPHIQKTLEQPMVMSMYDPINDIGTIVLMESKRHSDGSAKMYQRFIGPSYFDRKSDGGGLTDMQYETMVGEFGQNPAEAHKGTGQLNHSFTSITANGLATLAGLIMHHKRSTFGLHINNIPLQRYWKTESGSFRVTITHHLESKVKPEVFMIVPRYGFQGGSHPMYTIDQPEGTRLVFSGVTLLNATDAASSFGLDPYLLDYTTKKEKGWSGIAVAIFAAISVAAVIATGGALGVIAPGAISATQAAAFTFGVVAGVSAVSGTLFDKTTTSALNVTSVTETDSNKSWIDKFEKPNAKYRGVVLDGPTSQRYLDVDIPTGRMLNRQIISEWHNHIDPLYNIQDSKYDYREPNLQVQARPDPDEFFDNPLDNPNYSEDICVYGTALGAIMGISICRNYDNFGGGGEN